MSRRLQSWSHESAVSAFITVQRISDYLWHDTLVVIITKYNELEGGEAAPPLYGKR